MGYWNPVHRYGFRRWAQALKDAGGAGAITPDLIPEEAPEWLEACATSSLDPVFLVAPSSTDERIAVVGRTNRGFVYAAAVMGVTGRAEPVGRERGRWWSGSRRRPTCRSAVGLGVSTGAQAAQVAGFADGVVVGLGPGARAAGRRRRRRARAGGRARRGRAPLTPPSRRH
jgi:tryptophan synthase alpha chain